MGKRIQKCALIVLLTVFYFSSLHAEAFGNSSLTIPKVGLSFFDAPLLFHKKPWGLTHQWTFGTAFMQALDYRFWWVVETTMGFGQLTVAHKPYIGAFSGGAGIRFNLFQGDFRPHCGVMIHYLHFLGEGVKGMPLNLGWPIFVGLKPYMGIEWLFYSEMALEISGSYGVYVNINEPFRQILHAHASFAFYF